MADAVISLRIDLPNGSRIGPGKVALLESVRRHRSISAAARDQAMSYRRAWLLIDDLNHAFSEPVVETFPGRSQGSGAALTALGERLIAAYRVAERQCEKAAAGPLAEIAAACDRSYASFTRGRSRRKAVARGA